jgi:hypothetical protein
MDNLILNQITFIGEEKLLNKVIKLLVSANNSNISNLLPIPKELQKNKVFNFSEKLKNYNKYKVSTYSDWINTFWGNENFGDIILINAEKKKMTFNFYSEFCDSKIILINIQKKYPKLNVKALFQLEDGAWYEHFESRMIKGEVFYRINNGELCKYSCSTKLRIDELEEKFEHQLSLNVA